MMELNTLLDRSFDVLLNSARENGLTWLPWVGKNYRNTDQKLLVVAESHYSNEPDNEKRQRSLEDNASYEDYTRDIVWECPIQRQWSNKMFANLHRALFTTDAIAGELLWKHISFYNFIQRPLNYTTQWRERPTNDEYSAAWRVFINVAKVLQPRECLFVGNTAANTFNSAMATLGIEHSHVEIVGFFNNAYMKRASITLGGRCIRIIFIRHASQFFSWSEWHGKIKEAFPDTIDFLCQAVKPGNADDDTPVFPVSERNFTQDIPTWLQHKPVIACSYSELTGNNEEDAKFISIGRAQYNNKCASVKIFRYSEDGGRWSRQSEEVPIHRLAYMMQIFLASIIHTQQKGKDSYQSSAHEEIVSPVDMDFLQNEINANSEEIINGLAVVHDMLHSINLGNISI